MTPVIGPLVPLDCLPWGVFKRLYFYLAFFSCLFYEWLGRSASITHDKNVDFPHPSSPSSRIVDVALSSWVPCESVIAIEAIKVLFRVVEKEWFLNCARRSR